MLIPCEGFFVKLCKVPYRGWSHQQKWVAGLIVALFLFNDPFFPATLYTTSSVIWDGLHILTSVGFVSALLMFWLCVFEETGSVGNRVRSTNWGITFYAPKATLCILFWIFMSSLYIHVRLESQSNPEYSTSREAKQYQTITALAFLLATIYVLWLLFLITKAMGEIRRMSPPFKFIFWLTLFTIVATIVGIFIGALYPLYSAPINFTTYYGLYNLYVWALALAYAPLSTSRAFAYTQDMEMASRRDDGL
jgi:hypothetical protein